MFSSRMNGIELSGIRKMFDLAMEDSVNLGLGEPDFQPPKEAIDAMENAMRGGLNKYGPTNGILPLREAIAFRMKKYWKGASPDHVVVTTSGTQALFSAMLTIVDKGDGVHYPDPRFVMYEPHTKILGGVAIPYKLTIENDFRPDVEELERSMTDHSKMIIVNSPNNPTGGMITRQDRDDIVNIAREHDLFILSDEVYDSIIFTGSTHHSFLGQYEKAILANSFSKLYAMTGWRVGWLAAEDEIIRKISLAHYHMVACPNTPVEYGALAALKTGDRFIEGMVREFEGRRDIITKRINEIPGFHALAPPGTFYSFPSFDLHGSKGRLKAEELSMELARNGLICSPGTAFGPNGEYHLRFSFVNNKENILKGMNILEKVTKRYRS